ncbi:MAG TPA: VOC family protein [Trueperaceae bacterium]
MIDFVGTISVFVKDQDRAKAFYTEKLGFELKVEAPLGPGSSARWIAVAPPAGQTELILYLMDENWQHYAQTMGKTQSITLAVTDMKSTHEELLERGVKFLHDPDPQPWGTYATIEDSEGNRLMLVEQRGG